MRRMSMVAAALTIALHGCGGAGTAVVETPARVEPGPSAASTPKGGSAKRAIPRSAGKDER